MSQRSCARLNLFFLIHFLSGRFFGLVLVRRARFWLVKPFSISVFSQGISGENRVSQNRMLVSAIRANNGRFFFCSRKDRIQACAASLEKTTERKKMLTGSRDFERGF